MTTVNDIKHAIEKLSDKERAELENWLQHRSDDSWDHQMIRDIDGGKLDSLIAQVKQGIQRGDIHEMLYFPRP